MERLSFRLDILQTHITNLTDRYEDTVRQFDCSLSGADRVKLEAELESIDREIIEVEREIRSLE
jgi:cell division protein FtsB